jgi:hypothetical protein
MGVKQMDTPNNQSVLASANQSNPWPIFFKRKKRKKEPKKENKRKYNYIFF